MSSTEFVLTPRLVASASKFLHGSVHLRSWLRSLQAPHLLPGRCGASTLRILSTPSLTMGGGAGHEELKRNQRVSCPAREVRPPQPARAGRATHCLSWSGAQSTHLRKGTIHAPQDWSLTCPGGWLRPAETRGFKLQAGPLSRSLNQPLGSLSALKNKQNGKYPSGMVSKRIH